MMKLAAQKFIELKSEHFGKDSMSLFGGEFIRRLMPLAPIGEVADTNACDEALARFASSNSDEFDEADCAAIAEGMRAAEASAPNTPSKKRSAPAAPLRWPSDDVTKANTHHNVVWLNIVSNDTKQDWHKVRTRTHD